MDTQEFGKLFLMAGAFLAIVGLILIFRDRVPGLDRLGQLPGDLKFERENLRVYFPFATSLIISVVLSLLFWLFRSKGS